MHPVRPDGSGRRRLRRIGGGRSAPVVRFASDHRGLAALPLILAMLAAGTVWGWPRPVGATVPSPDRPASSTGWLDTRGGEIVDQLGRTVELRGFNVDALIDHRAAELGNPAPLDDGDAALMASSGLDVVRLPIAWSLLEPERGRFDAAYLDGIAAAVALLERHGLVLDMHFGIGWGVRSEIPAWVRIGWVPDWRPIPSPPWSESRFAERGRGAGLVLGGERVAGRPCPRLAGGGRAVPRRSDAGRLRHLQRASPVAHPARPVRHALPLSRSTRRPSPASRGSTPTTSSSSRARCSATSRPRWSGSACRAWSTRRTSTWGR
jgi:hypothetical protein